MTTVEKNLASPPTTVTSKLNVCRFKLRALRYRMSFSKAPKKLEIANLALAVIGAWTVVRFAAKQLSNAPLTQILVASIAVAVMVAYLVGRRIGNFESIFDRASTSIELAMRLHTDATKGLQSQDGWRVLARIYQELIATINDGSESKLTLQTRHDMHGQPFLCGILPAPEGQALADLVDPRISGNRVFPTAARFAEPRQAFIRRLRNVDAFKNPMGDEEGDNLVLNELSLSGDQIRLSCGVATYGEIVRTSDALQNEFAVFAFLSSADGGKRRRSLTYTSADSLGLMPWRQQVHKWSGSARNLFFSPRGRAAGLGVSVAMVTTDDRGHESAFVARRGAKVGVYPNVLHVVPSGMCNAKADLRAADARLPGDYLKWIMLEELLEECFDMPEMADSRAFDWISAITSALAAKGMEAISPRLTGLALDLLNLRWDVCARVETGPHGHRNDYKLCWEYTPLQPVRRLPLDRVAQHLDRRDVVQAGAASLLLAENARPALQSDGDDGSRHRG